MNRQPVSTISEKTKITLGVAFVMAAVISWAVHLYVISESNAQSIQAIQASQSRYSDDVSTLKADVSFIKRILIEEQKRNNQ